MSREKSLMLSFRKSQVIIFCHFQEKRVKINCLLSECGALSVAIALDVIRVGVRESLLTGVEANDDIEAEACFRNKYSNVRSHLYASLKVIMIS